MCGFNNVFRISLILCVFLMMLSACEKQPENKPESEIDESQFYMTETDSSETDGGNDTEKDETAAETDDVISEETSVISAETTTSAVETTDFAFSYEPVKTISDFELIENHNLSFTRYRSNGTVKVQNAIREPLLFTNNYFFYAEYFDVYVQMNAYDLDTHEIHGSFTYPFIIFENVYLEVGNRFFMAPCYYDSSNQLHMIFICYNLENHEPKIIHDVPVYNSPRVDIEKLDDDNILFFVYRKVDSQMVDTIYSYTISSDTISLIYEAYGADWTNPDLTTKDIVLIETFDEKVYMLKEQLIAGKLRCFLEVYSKTGDLLENHFLSDLNPYGDAKTRVWDMRVFGDYLYIDYSKNLNQYSLNMEKFLLFHKTNGVYEPVEIGDYGPNQILYDGLFEGKYILLKSTCEEYDMLSIDVVSNVLTPIRLEVSSEYNVYMIRCNSNGELIVIAERKDDKHQQDIFWKKIVLDQSS